jgi:hypothetical protein
MKTFKILILLVLFTTTKLFSQINMTTTSSHTQNFNTLATTGTTNTWTNNSTISSWYSQRTGTGTTYEATAGTANAGNLYSFGSTSSTDRAIGSVGSGNAAAGNFAHGVLLRNTSGNTITSITVTYTLEQWRNGNNTTPNVITFWYQTSASTISSLTPNTNTGWTQVTSLSTTSPINTTSAGSLDGNATANKSTLTNISIPSLSLANNSYIMLKWEDPDHTGTDHGLGIDDVTISWTTTSTPTATITGAATTSAFTTTYGTASTPQSFSISGSNLTASITATAPTGFEVSNDGTTYGSTTTFAQSSGSASGTLRIRLKSNASAGAYNSNNIVLSSTGASSVNITTPSIGNLVSTKTLTITGISFNNKVYDGTTTVTISGTPSYVGLVNSESFTVSGVVTWAFSSANVGSAISITRSGSYNAPSSNYTVTQPTGFANITKSNQTITFNDIPFKCSSDVDFAPATSSSGLTLTLISSNTSIATIVSNKVRIIGNGTCTITASQAGNTNYFAATNKSKTLIVKSPTSRWSFESVTASNIGTTPNFLSSSQTADIGSLTTGSKFTGFHSSNSTVWSCGFGGIVGNSSSKSLHATNWSVGDYFQFQLSTTYYDSLLLTVEQTSSSTGPRDFKLQYSLDSTSYTDITTYQVPYFLPSASPYAWSSISYQSQSAFSFDLSSLTQIHNQSLVYFRLVNTTTTALLGGTVQTTGTSRVDNITLMGNYDAPLDLEWWIRNNPKPKYIPQTVIVSDCDEPSTYYNFIGRKVEKLQPGKIYIKKSCGKSELFMISY